MPAVFIAAGNLIPFTKGMFVFRAPQPYCAGHSSPPYEGYTCFSRPTFVLLRTLLSSLRRVCLFFASHSRTMAGRHAFSAKKMRQETLSCRIFYNSIHFSPSDRSFQSDQARCPVRFPGSAPQSDSPDQFPGKASTKRTPSLLPPAPAVLPAAPEL